MVAAVWLLAVMTYPQTLSCSDWSMHLTVVRRRIVVTKPVLVERNPKPIHEKAQTSSLTSDCGSYPRDNLLPFFTTFPPPKAMTCVRWFPLTQPPYYVLSPRKDFKRMHENAGITSRSFRLVIFPLNKQEDRVIIVGCTSKPEAGDAKEFKNFFQKFLYVPAPDYASRLMLWHHFIRERLEQVRCLGSAGRPTGGIELVECSHIITHKKSLTDLANNQAKLASNQTTLGEASTDQARFIVSVLSPFVVAASLLILLLLRFRVYPHATQHAMDSVTAISVCARQANAETSRSSVTSTRPPRADVKHAFVLRFGSSSTEREHKHNDKLEEKPMTIRMHRDLRRKQQGSEGHSVQIGSTVDLSTLAHVSEGYTAGSIYRSVKTTLTPRRVHRIAKRPLLSSEFLGVLAQQQQLLVKNVQARMLP